MPNWEQLLCIKRLGRRDPPAESPSRSQFQRDYDRIVFSSAFRRLQDKTQVFPLAESDYVRTRLTHSLEVSCIGRTLGTLVGDEICRKYKLKEIDAEDFGAIVAAAALAHDIGNPPFGHSGESAIQHWFNTSDVAKELRKKLPKACVADISRYDGNAQGFRLLAKLLLFPNPGGLQLTCATLGAFTKYPVESVLPPGIKVNGDASCKKFGIFQSEKALFEEVAASTGLIRRSRSGSCWRRHPLAFIVEAADDIACHVIDFEDGYRLQLLEYQEVANCFERIIASSDAMKQAAEIEWELERIGFLRARAISALVKQARDVFASQEERIRAGKLDKAIMSMIPASGEIGVIIETLREKVYPNRRVVEIEAAGFEVIGGLLDVFVLAVNDVAAKGKDAAHRSKKCIQLLPEQYVGPKRVPVGDACERVMRVLDFVSGMTDSCAVTLHKKVKGIAIPGFTYENWRG